MGISWKPLGLLALIFGALVLLWALLPEPWNWAVPAGIFVVGFAAVVTHVERQNSKH